MDLYGGVLQAEHAETVEYIKNDHRQRIESLTEEFTATEQNAKTELQIMSAEREQHRQALNAELQKSQEVRNGC